MSLVEIIIIISVVISFYILISPLQKKLEKYLYSFFRISKSDSIKTIDVTDYSTKDTKNE